MGSTRSRTRTFASTAMAAVALSTVIAAPAHGAPDNKKFTVDIDSTTAVSAPEAWSGDSNATIAIVIKNTGPSQSLGSVNVTVPSPFALVSSPDDAVPGGPVLELRNLALAPGATVTKTITVDVRTCSAGVSGTFGVTAKQSNDYNGTGNDFALDPAQPSDRAVATTGVCKLAWRAEPADAEVGKPITGVDYSPAGTAVTVEVQDAGGTGPIGGSTSVPGQIQLGFFANPGDATLTASGPTTPVLGVATFAPRISESAFDYSLIATSTGGLSASAPSSAFDIVDDQVTCLLNASCSSTITKDGQTVNASFSGPGPASNLLVSVGAGDVPDFECANYPRTPGTVVSQFLFTAVATDRVGTFDVTIPDVSRPLNSYEVCWLAPYSFATDGGTSAPDSGIDKPGTTDALYVGTLPDCAKKGTAALPCVAGRSYQKSASAVKISVRADGRDPWRY